MPKYAGASANVSTLLDSILHGYDKRLRPNYKVKGGNKGERFWLDIKVYWSFKTFLMNRKIYFVEIKENF